MKRIRSAYRRLLCAKEEFNTMMRVTVTCTKCIIDDLVSFGLSLYIYDTSRHFLILSTADICEM